MTAIEWNKQGHRFFESGLDRGVLYVNGVDGVPWNGLTKVSDAPSGGEPRAYYMEGIKYLNRSAPEEHTGTIEAFTYPDEFAICDGTIETPFSFSVHQQDRAPFSLSYRTRIGNDVDSVDHAYKIHLIYNALASPSQKNHASSGSNLDPLTFSWSFTTTPLIFPGYRPVSHVSIDTRGVSKTLVRYIEELLYGTETTAPQIPTPQGLIDLFNSLPDFWEILPNAITGLGNLAVAGHEDLMGSIDSGVFDIPTTSRLRPTDNPGIYNLET